MSARRPGRMLLLAMVALILAALAPVPASADHAPPPGDLAGSGEVHGTEIVQEEAFTGSLCLRATKTVFGLRGVGTYYGRTAGGQDVVYKAELSGPSQTLYGDGPVRLELENTETYYHGPYGTHGTSDASCAPATAGGAVPAEFRIFAPEHIYRLDGTGAQGPCKGQGTFTRGGGTAEASRWHADWTLTDDCTVVGNAAGTPGSGVTRAGTAMTHHGSHEPCFSPPCPDNLQIDYKQYPPAVGLHVSLSGPTSVTVGGAATVTARVTNDGVAVPNATVTFAVTGAGPATPPAGTALTGADGRATFTFTAAVAGTYTVTASTTSGGTTASSTFAVQFSPPPPPTLTMDGPTRAQTEESITVGATFTSSGNALPGVTVNFAVTGAGQSTPATGSATTDANGRAAFTFAANRAGEYTVNASATHLGQATSAAHVLRLDIRTFQRVGALTLPEGDTLGSAAVVDPGGKYAYFGDFESVVKIDLDTFQRVGAVTLPPATGEWDLASAVIDPAGRYAYFGTRALSQAKVIKIDLATFQRVDAITLNPGEEVLDAAVIDPAGAYAYFATAGPNNDPEVSRSRVVKIDLATFQRVGALTFSTGETEVHAAVIDAAGTYAYFAARGAGNSPAAVVKVDLRTFQRVGAAILNGAAERDVLSAVIDPGGAFAYFGTTHTATDPTRVVKVDLTTFQRAGALIVGNGSEDLVTAVIDPVGHFAYFGTETPGSGLSDPADRVLKLDLSAFERVGAITLPPEEKNVKSAVIDPDGTHVYFGSAGWGTISFPTPPSKVVKIAVSRPPSAWLVATSDSYSPPYASPLSVAAPGVLANDDDTQDNDPLSASLVRPPAHGDVTLNANGSFSYTPDSGFSGTDTFTYSFDDAMNVSAPATVSITVGAAPQGVQAVSGGAFGFETNVSLFGGPASVKGGAGSTCGQAGQPVCADGQSPAVSLPASGGQLTATDPDGNIGQYGPAYIFENHGPLTASAQGSTGPSGSVTATAAVDKVEDNDPFHAGSPDGGVSSTCTAGQSVLSGLTRIVNGRLVTSTDPTTGDVATEVTFPHDWSPAPNTEYRGTLDHVGDAWRMVFNEQVLSTEAITVNAVHMYLLGPTAVGDMIIGSSRCGVVTAAANAAPVGNDDAYTATAGRPLVVAAAGVLANDTDADGQALTAAKPAGTRPPASGGGSWTFPGEPAHGTLDLRTDGSFTYTPAPGYVGPDSFTYLAQDSRGKADPATVSLTVAPATAKATADFDGNGSTDLSVFRSTSGTWYLQGSAQANYGASGDVAVPADYDGDGKADVAVFRPSNGVWYVRGSAGADSAVAFGASGDIPVPADYDGDGRSDRAVFRNGVWYVQGLGAVAFGASGDIPVPADYDGDAKADLAVFRSGVWYVKGSAGTDSAVAFGTSGDVPVPGDYDGDGDAEVAVFRPAAGVWFVQGGAATAWGTSGDVPVPGDYDGDGDLEIAVFRPSNGVWFVQGGATTAWGANGDVPLPLPAAVYRSMG